MRFEGLSSDKDQNNKIISHSSYLKMYLYIDLLNIALKFKIPFEFYASSLSSLFILIIILNSLLLLYIH